MTFDDSWRIVSRISWWCARRYRETERVTELVEEVGIDFFAALERVFQRVDQARARLLYTAL